MALCVVWVAACLFLKAVASPVLSSCALDITCQHRCLLKCLGDPMAGPNSSVHKQPPRMLGAGRVSFRCYHDEYKLTSCSLSAAPGTGTWSKVEYGERAARLGWLSRDSGLVIYQLKTTLSRVDGVHDVEARLTYSLTLPMHDVDSRLT